MFIFGFLLGVLHVESLYWLSRDIRLIYLSSPIRVFLLGAFFGYVGVSYGLKELLLSLLAFNLGMVSHIVLRGWFLNGLIKRT